MCDVANQKERIYVSNEMKHGHSDMNVKRNVPVLKFKRWMHELLVGSTGRSGGTVHEVGMVPGGSVALLRGGGWRASESPCRLV